MTIDFTKPVQTRSGLPVRILCTNRNDPNYPVVGLVMSGKRNEGLTSWTLSGVEHMSNPGADMDLINVPEVRHMWLRIEYHTFKDSRAGELAVTKESAKSVPPPFHDENMAIVKFTFTNDILTGVELDND